MHIVHVVPAITIGGLWRILQAAARDARRDLTVISIFGLDDCQALKHLDAKVIQLGRTIDELEMESYISDLIYSALRQLRPDIVQSHHLYSDIYALPAARHAHIKAIRMVHGVTQATKSSPLNREQVKTEWTDDEITIELGLECICSGTLAVSTHLKQRLVRYGFESSRIGVLHPGVDLDYLRHIATPRESKRSHLTIGFVGRLEMVKNPLILPHVAIELAKRGHSPRFLVIGDGRQRELLIRSIEELGMRDQFTLMPMTFDLYNLYSLIDVLMMPSFSEGLPLVLIEAMALGIPTVATSVGGIPEVINNGVNGYLCQPGDASDIAVKIAYLIENRELRASFGTAGKETVAREFSLDKHLRSLFTFYSRVMEEVPLGIG